MDDDRVRQLEERCAALLELNAGLAVARRGRSVGAATLEVLETERLRGEVSRLEAEVAELRAVNDGLRRSLAAQQASIPARLLSRLRRRQATS